MIDGWMNEILYLKQCEFITPLSPLKLSLVRASGSSFRKGSTAVGTWPIG